MSVEVRPLGVKCNIQCTYCYQQPQRDANKPNAKYDLSLIKAKVESAKSNGFTLFGGEPLLLPWSDLEELLRWGFEKFGKSSIQTNGTLVSPRHIELFKTYKTSVGVSMDGPGALNDARRVGSLHNTREATQKSERAIYDLCSAGISTSLIITLHRLNALQPRLGLLCEWVKYLEAVGLRSVRLHVLEIETSNVRSRLALTDAENIAAFEEFEKLEPGLSSLSLDIFSDLERMLVGDDSSVTCVWRGCDPYNTRAVQGIEGDGSSSNCGRTNKDGIDFAKSDGSSYERYIALYRTSQVDGGCNGCRFFFACKGQCPGTSLDGDWRNRSENCGVWMTLFERAERRLIAGGQRPLSQLPQRTAIESALLDAWRVGKNPNISSILKREAGRSS